LALLALVACGGDGEQDADPTNAVSVAEVPVATNADPAAEEPGETNAAGLLFCEAVDGGAEFWTALDTCVDARELGQRLAVETGAAGPSATGTELVYSLVCSAIQQDETTMSANSISMQLATELHERGVCPGDLGMLSPE